MPACSVTPPRPRAIKYNGPPPLVRPTPPPTPQHPPPSPPPAPTPLPRTSRRSTDNREKPLTRADLVRAQDPVCTYDRVLRYDAATTRYKIDRPAPDCSDYTIP